VFKNEFVININSLERVIVRGLETAKGKITPKDATLFLTFI